MLIVTCPVCPGVMVPPEGDAPSQLINNCMGLALHLRGLVPLLVIVTTWPVGLGCPCVLLKLRLSGEAPIIGANEEGVCTVSCTIIVSVLCPETNERLP